MEDDVFGAGDGFAGTVDQLFAALAEELDGDVVGDAFFVDETADEIELGLGSGRKTDFDFLEADFHQQIEVLEFLLDAHGLGEGLIAVAQVDATPDGRTGERAVGPLAVGQIHRRERPVFGDRSRLHERNSFEGFYWRGRVKHHAPRFGGRRAMTDRRDARSAAHAALWDRASR